MVPENYSSHWIVFKFSYFRANFIHSYIYFSSAFFPRDLVQSVSDKFFMNYTSRCYEAFFSCSRVIFVHEFDGCYVLTGDIFLELYYSYAVEPTF